MLTPRYQIGDYIADRYEVRQVHFGGMGEVYLTYDHTLNCPFALKTFQDTYLTDQRVKNLFIGEAETWIQLGHHMNVVQAERVKIIDGKPYVVLQCVVNESGKSETLASMISQKELDISLTLRIGLYICLGMVHCCKKIPSLVHRDLKPSNILIAHSKHQIRPFSNTKQPSSTENEHTEELVRLFPKITDFGLVTAVSGGTPAYMSPEQKRGQPLAVSSDIFSFGLIMQDMLNTVLQKSETESNSIAIDEGDINSVFSPFLNKCLRQSSHERFQTFYEVGEEIDKLYTLLFGPSPGVETETQFVPGVTAIMKVQTFKNAVSFQSGMQDRKDNDGNLEELQRKGLSLHELGRYDEALRCFDELLDKLPDKFHGSKDEANVLILKANSMSAIGQGEEAINCYKRAIEIDPKDSNGWYNLGETLYNVIRDLKGAENAYKKALAINPKDDMAWSSLGFVVSAQGKKDEAIASFDRAIAINPKLVNAHGNKGTVLLENEDAEGALVCFETALEIDPGNPITWFFRGKALVHLGRIDKAIICMKRAVALAPKNIQLQRELEAVRRLESR